MGTRLTRRRRERLALAVICDVDEQAVATSFGLWDHSSHLALARAIRDVPDGAELPDEIPDGTDGTTNEERVALALDFYGI